MVAERRSDILSPPFREATNQLLIFFAMLGDPPRHSEWMEQVDKEVVERFWSAVEILRAYRQASETYKEEAGETGEELGRALQPPLNQAFLRSTIDPTELAETLLCVALWARAGKPSTLDDLHRKRLLLRTTAYSIKTVFDNLAPKRSPGQTRAQTVRLEAAHVFQKILAGELNLTI